MTTDISNTKLRVEYWPEDGTWAVREGDEDDWNETNYYGYVARDFPNEAEAKTWLENELLERQCREWERHVRQDEDDEPIPF